MRRLPRPSWNCFCISANLTLTAIRNLSRNGLRGDQRRPPRDRLLARNDFRVARDLGVVEWMLLSQVRAAIFTVGLPRPRLDAQKIQAQAVKKPCQRVLHCSCVTANSR